MSTEKKFSNCGELFVYKLKKDECLLNFNLFLISKYKFIHIDTTGGSGFNNAGIFIQNAFEVIVNP